MSEDSFTEITTESWFSRIGGAIKGIVIGLALFIAAFPGQYTSPVSAIDHWHIYSVPLPNPRDLWGSLTSRDFCVDLHFLFLGPAQHVHVPPAVALVKLTPSQAPLVTTLENALSSY